jgi:hypothetical protein
MPQPGEYVVVASPVIGVDMAAPQGAPRWNTLCSGLHVHPAEPIAAAAAANISDLFIFIFFFLFFAGRMMMPGNSTPQSAWCKRNMSLFFNTSALRRRIPATFVGNEKYAHARTAGRIATIRRTALEFTPIACRPAA